MIYNYKVKDTNGEMASLDEYKGKVLLVVNTATGCGFTPQYEGLQKLYDKYKDRGFEILDFPCNQFFNQAPGDDEEIKSFCTLNYGTTFRRFSKIDVNGEGADPVYKYLRTEAPEADEDDKSKELYDFLSSKGFNTSGDEIKWNFTKFLIDKDGKIVKRFAPTVDPEKIEKEIKLYIDRINEPIVVSFNKFEDNDVIKEINIEDACCEYCMEGNIENLLQLDGIGSFSYNQDTNYFNVSAKLGYNPNKISKEKLKEIEESLEA